jgi:anti-anti-sigma factor
MAPMSTESELRAFSAASIDATRSGPALTITVAGRFDFNCHERFRLSYVTVEGAREFLIDLSGANYIDSSALGMLLILRDHVGPLGTVRIVSASEQVKRILKITNFDKVFGGG